MSMIRLKYVHTYRDRHGRVRRYFRRAGYPKTPLPGDPGSSEFMAAYEAAMDGKPLPKQIGASRTRPGSISALLVSYYASPEFQGLSDATKVTYRGILERFRADHGTKLVSQLQREHVKTIIGNMNDRPAAANNLLRMMRMVMRFAVDIEWRTDDPTLNIKGFKNKSGGFHTWTEGEIARFEAAWPIGTNERLALALLLYTAQRRGDVVRMGWQHISAGKLAVTQSKTGAELEIPIHSELRRVLDATATGNMTFIVTAYGRPRTPAGFGGWFSGAARKAGLATGCSAHGLRKAACRRLAEAGATPHEIMSISGHKTLKEVTRYTAAVEQPRMAETAMSRLDGPDREQTLANLPEKLANLTHKTLKVKD